MQPSTDPSLLRAFGTEPLPAAPSLAAPKRNRSQRAVFLGWLRKTHLYVGLWGAVLGLLFGATGINNSGHVTVDSQSGFAPPITHGFRTAANSPVNAATDDLGRRVDAAKDLLPKSGSGKAERDHVALRLHAMASLLRATSRRHWNCCAKKSR